MSTKTVCSRRILVVEDDCSIREALEDALAFEGYDVVCATNGQEGLEALRSGASPCIVLLDMMMPIMGGREFLDTLAGDQALAPIPVLVLSAIADRKNTEGAVGFIKKPADLHTVLSAIQKYCDRPAAQSTAI